MTKKIVEEVVEHLLVDSVLFDIYEECTVDEMLANVKGAIDDIKEMNPEGEIVVKKSHFGCYDGTFILSFILKREETEEEYQARLYREAKAKQRRESKQGMQEKAAQKLRDMFESDEEMMAVLKRLADK
jgi:hypothetical protein